VEDIEKFKSDFTIKFSVKMRYLKLLIEVIHLAHNDISTLWNKTVTLIIEILSVRKLRLIDHRKIRWMPETKFFMNLQEHVSENS
jgi:hypothetical protein